MGFFLCLFVLCLLCQLVLHGLFSHPREQLDMRTQELERLRREGAAAMRHQGEE